MTDLQGFLATFRPKIEDQLTSSLTDITQNDLQGLFDQELAYAVLNGGKKIRPLITLLVVDAFGKNIDSQIIQQANAIEFIHAYSLVHDDLPAMDNDDLRRGLPTVHKKYGEAKGILIGDVLLTSGFGQVIAPQKPAITAQLVKKLSHVANQMVAGQLLDLAGETKQYQLDDLMQVHALKTGALLAYAFEAGGILAQTSLTNQEKLATIGRLYGIAYQINDDLDDAKQASDSRLNQTAARLDVSQLQAKLDDLRARIDQEMAKIDAQHFKPALLQELIGGIF